MYCVLMYMYAWMQLHISTSWHGASGGDIAMVLSRFPLA
jgi:hypothetical protein